MTDISAFLGEQHMLRAGVRKDGAVGSGQGLASECLVRHPEICCLGNTAGPNEMRGQIRSMGYKTTPETCQTSVPSSMKWG